MNNVNTAENKLTAWFEYPIPVTEANKITVCALRLLAIGSMFTTAMLSVSKGTILFTATLVAMGAPLSVAVVYGIPLLAILGTILYICRKASHGEAPPVDEWLPSEDAVEELMNKFYKSLQDKYYVHKLNDSALLHGGINLRREIAGLCENHSIAELLGDPENRVKLEKFRHLPWRSNNLAKEVFEELAAPNRLLTKEEKKAELVEQIAKDLPQKFERYKIEINEYAIRPLLENASLEDLLKYWERPNFVSNYYHELEFYCQHVDKTKWAIPYILQNYSIFVESENRDNIKALKKLWGFNAAELSTFRRHPTVDDAELEKRYRDNLSFPSAKKPQGPKQAHQQQQQQGPKQAHQQQQGPRTERPQAPKVARPLGEDELAAQNRAKMGYPELGYTEAYRKRSLELHPDKNNGEDAPFKELQSTKEAYEVWLKLQTNQVFAWSDPTTIVGANAIVAAKHKINDLHPDIIIFALPIVRQAETTLAEEASLSNAYDIIFGAGSAKRPDPTTFKGARQFLFTGSGVAEPDFEGAHDALVAACEKISDQKWQRAKEKAMFMLGQARDTYKREITTQAHDILFGPSYTDRHDPEKIDAAIKILLGRDPKIAAEKSELHKHPIAQNALDNLTAQQDKCRRSDDKLAAGIALKMLDLAALTITDAREYAKKKKQEGKE